MVKLTKAQPDAGKDESGMEWATSLAEANPDDFIATLLAVDPETSAKHVRLLRLIVVLMGCLFLSIVGNIYEVTQPRRLVVIASKSTKTPDDPGRYQVLRTLPEPINTEQSIRDWVTNAVVQAYTFDFDAWNNQLGAVRQNFTPAGWLGFKAAVKDSGVLKAVLDNKFKITAVPRGPTVMSTLPGKDKVDKWTYEVPITVSYEGMSNKYAIPLMVSVTAIKQPPSQQPRGLGIDSMTVQGNFMGAK